MGPGTGVPIFALIVRIVFFFALWGGLAFLAFRAIRRTLQLNKDMSWKDAVRSITRRVVAGPPAGSETRGSKARESAFAKLERDYAEAYDRLSFSIVVVAGGILGALSGFPQSSTLSTSRRSATGPFGYRCY